MDRRAMMLAPLGLAVVAGGGFLAMLRGMRSGAFDPHATGNPQVGRPVPAFDLPAQAPGDGFGSADLRAAGGPVLINFFASWCVPCLVEHPNLMTLKQAGVAVWGIAYKDDAAKAGALLDRNGNPYARVARDAPGRVAIDFGVTGVPESYLVDRTGIIRWRFAGPLLPDVIDKQLRPALQALA